MEDIRCARPTGDHLLINDNSTSYAVDTTLYVTCQEGYLTKGSRLIACQLSGVWSPGIPECTERSSTSLKNNAVIISVCTVASAVALVIIVLAAFMLLRNCRRERQVKEQQETYQRKMLDISQYFAVTQDCVGMPPLIFDNIDTEMRGRSQTSSLSSVQSTTSPSSPEDADSPDKVFIY